MAKETFPGKKELKGKDDFLDHLKRTHQVKVSLNQKELASLNELVEHNQSDKASVFRMLLKQSTAHDFNPSNSEHALSKEKITSNQSDLIPIEYLEKLKNIFERSLISEEEYKTLKQKALGL